MTTALICPGPSLPDYWCDELGEEYDDVVAVNSAAHVFTCDYIATVDNHIVAPILHEHRHVPLKGFISHQTWLKQFKVLYPNHEMILLGPYHGTDVSPEMEKRMNSDKCGYTMPNALYFCATRVDYGDIHIFGFDAAMNQPDVVNGPGDRRWLRWYNELRWLKAYWHPAIKVFSTIDPEILVWLADGNRRSDPPLPPKHGRN